MSDETGVQFVGIVPSAKSVEADKARSRRAQELVDGIEALEKKIASLESEGPAGEWKREMHRQSIAVMVDSLRALA